MADAVSDSFSGRRETEVTSMFNSSSRLSFFSWLAVPTATLVCANPTPAQARKIRMPGPSAGKNTTFRKAWLSGTTEISFILIRDFPTGDRRAFLPAPLSEGNQGDG